MKSSLDLPRGVGVAVGDARQTLNDHNSSPLALPGQLMLKRFTHTIAKLITIYNILRKIIYGYLNSFDFIDI